MELFTLIATKSKSSDWCMSCKMAEYDGDQQIMINLSEEELIEKLASLMALDLRINESGYSFLILGLFAGRIERLYSDDWEESIYNKEYDSEGDPLLDYCEEFDTLTGRIQEMVRIARKKGEEGKLKKILEQREAQREQERTVHLPNCIPVKSCILFNRSNLGLSFLSLRLALSHCLHRASKPSELKALPLNWSFDLLSRQFLQILFPLASTLKHSFIILSPSRLKVWR